MHLKFVGATSNAAVACDEYRYKGNIALESGLLEGRYSSVKLTMDNGYPFLVSKPKTIHLLYLFNGKKYLVFNFRCCTLLTKFFNEKFFFLQLQYH